MFYLDSFSRSFFFHVGKVEGAGELGSWRTGVGEGGAEGWGKEEVIGLIAVLLGK